MAAAVTRRARHAGDGVRVRGRAERARAPRAIWSNGQERELDNGQHILVGAYTELFRLMRTVGVPADALRIRTRSGTPTEFAFRALWLPRRLGCWLACSSSGRCPSASASAH